MKKISAKTKSTATKTNKACVSQKKTRHKLAAVLSALLAAAQVFTGGLSVDFSHSLAAQLPDASQIISLTNNYRTENNLVNLTESPVLDQAAKAKLADMQANGYWDHVSPAGVQPWEFIEKAGYNYSFAGENLGKGYSSAEGVVNAWVESPKHKENLVSPNFKEIGVAVGTAEVDGKSSTVIVQMFGSPKLSPTETSNFSTLVMGAKSEPALNLMTPVSNSKLPYFILWFIIFSLIVFDGIELRRCGLHTSKKHMFEFRSALLINCFAFLLLFVNIVSLA